MIDPEGKNGRMNQETGGELHPRSAETQMSDMGAQYSRNVSYWSPLGQLLYDNRENSWPSKSTHDSRSGDLESLNTSNGSRVRDRPPCTFTSLETPPSKSVWDNDFCILPHISQTQAYSVDEDEKWCRDTSAPGVYERITDTPFKWMIFNTEGFLDDRSPWSNSSYQLTRITGLVGAQITRVVKEGRRHSKPGYFWTTAVESRSLLQIVFLLVAIAIVIPTAVSMLLAALPLYELQKPTGTEGFVSFERNWGWVLHNTFELIFVDVVFMSVQRIYATSGDHPYFPLWLTLLKILLATILQDFVPRTMRKFPVPLLGTIMHFSLGITAALIQTWSFHGSKLPETERGESEPTLLESVLSLGASTLAKKEAWNKKMISLTNFRNVRATSDHANVHGRVRSASFGGQKRSERVASTHLPDYDVFFRRRCLVFLCTINVFGWIYVSCVSLTPLLRLAKDEAVLQSLVLLVFALITIIIQKGFVSKIKSIALYGGPLWDGRMWKRLSRLNQQYDQRVHVSGFRYLEYYCTCMYVLYLHYATAEFTSLRVLASAHCIQVAVLLGPIFYWLLVCNPNEPSISSNQVAPVESLKSNNSRPKQHHRKESVLGVKHQASVNPLKYLCQTLHQDVQKILLANADLGHLSPDIVKQMYRARGMSMRAMSWSRKKLVRTASSKSFDKKDTELLAITVSPADEIEWEFCKRWSLEWLVPFKKLSTPSRSHIPLDDSLQQEMDINRIPRELSSGPVRRRNSVHLPLVHTKSTLPCPTDHELIFLGNMMSSMQTLFLAFVGICFGTVNFLSTYSFLRYGYNSHSFPFERQCHSQFVFSVLSSVSLFINALLCWGSGEILIRYRTGLSMFSLGSSVFYHGQSRIIIISIGILAFSSIWRFTVDHSRHLLYFEEDAGLAIPTAFC